MSQHFSREQISRLISQSAKISTALSPLIALAISAASSWYATQSISVMEDQTILIRDQLAFTQAADFFEKRDQLALVNSDQRTGDVYHYFGAEAVYSIEFPFKNLTDSKTIIVPDSYDLVIIDCRLSEELDIGDRINSTYEENPDYLYSQNSRNPSLPKDPTSYPRYIVEPGGEARILFRFDPKSYPDISRRIYDGNVYKVIFIFYSMTEAMAHYNALQLHDNRLIYTVANAHGDAIEFPLYIQKNTAVGYIKVNRSTPQAVTIHDCNHARKVRR